MNYDLFSLYVIGFFKKNPHNYSFTALQHTQLLKTILINHNNLVKGSNVSFWYEVQREHLRISSLSFCCEQGWKEIL